MFYELYDPQLSEQLTPRNAKDTASSEGKTYELKVIQEFFTAGKVLQICLPSNFIGGITAYIVVGKNGDQERVVVLPEGSATQCILKETKVRSYPTPPSSFVVKASIRVTE